MEILKTVCISVLCFVFTAEGGLENEEWKIRMEKKMEEMFRMIERQNAVIEEHTRTIERQTTEIKDLRRKVTIHERKSGLAADHNQAEQVHQNDGNGRENSGNLHLHNSVSVLKPQRLRRFLASPSEQIDTEGQVAFYAYISKDFGGVGVNHVFLYDTVVTNYGNAYSQHTGAFTAPSTGVYAFSYTAYASGEHVAGESGDYGEVTVQLLHNGVYKGSIHVDTETNWEEEMSTGFAILSLKTGDVVITMSKGHGQGSFHSDSSGRWSFSGFQII